MTGTKKREHGDGGIDQRGADTYRLRYRTKGKRFAVTFHGTRAEAKTELRRLVRTADTGEHIAPDKMTLAEWITHWLNIGAPGRKKKQAGRRTLERYGQLLNCHVVPTLGATRLQQLQSTDIDTLYDGLEGKMAPRTAHHVHVVLNGCLNAAVRKALLPVNPIDRAEKVPSPGESDHGQALDEDQLAALVQGFRKSALYPLVATAAFTGTRLNEILALRWSDLNPGKKATAPGEKDVPPTLRIERAMEETKAGGRTVKPPKTERGIRTIEIDEGLLAVLLDLRQKHLRLATGIPDGAAVDMALVRLPETALMFPSMEGTTLDLTRLRDARAASREFRRQARGRGGFRKLTFKDLRGTHETILLDRGVPVHVVAARCGHDPAVLLRTYAKRTRKADTSAAAVIGALSKGAFG